ncbi:hypothetical protein [Buttiauxella agrestis]|uniref:hypothetical protein n=1 Tax=Buttiauxella agrestis TaxID=82977 RepID=UPI0039752351
MNLLFRLEKIDAALHRFWARWSRWLCRGLILLVVIWAGNLAWAVFFGPPTGGVQLVIHNDLDRPVLGFSVNGVAGGNALAHGGGAVTCCGNISEKNAEVIWTLSTTRAQYNTGLRKETRHKILPLPERKWGENFLHVYFLPGDNIRLWWGEGLRHPWRNIPDYSEHKNQEKKDEYK